MRDPSPAIASGVAAGAGRVIPVTDTPAAAGPAPAIPDHALLRRIGAGSYGEVWLARSALGTLRAVKIVRRSAFDDDRPYEREFAGLQKFEPLSRTHEGFVDLLQVGRNDAEGWFYYVMELADAVQPRKEEGGLRTELGGPVPPSAPPAAGRPPSSVFDPLAYAPATLASVVRTRGARPLDEGLAIARTLTAALAELHRHSLVHRDIKPSNIIFVGGVPKLADVGLVAAAKGVGQDRSFVGTEGFIPPEGPGTPAADLYSLGIVLYVLGTGKSHRDFPEPPADLATRPDREGWLEFSAVIHRAAHADPKQRYASARDMLADLERLGAGKSVRCHWARRRAIRWGGAVLLVAAVAAAGLRWQSARRHAARAVLPSGLGWTTNKLAAAAWEKANFLHGTVRPESTATAGRYLEEALRLDPNFAYAHASLANNVLTAINQGFRETLEAYPEAERHIREALRIEPRLAWAQVIWADLLTRQDYAWQEAELALRRAVELSPSFVRARERLASAVFVPQARFDEAFEQLDLALEKDPSDTGNRTSYCQALHFARRQADALAEAEEILRLYPGLRMGRQLRARILIALGRPKEAAEQYRSLVRDTPDLFWLQAALFHAQTLAGEAPPEGPTLDQLLDRADQPRGAVSLALAYTALNDPANALTWLEKAYDRRDSELRFLKVEPRFDPLRSEPRFQELLKKTKLAP